MFLSNLFFIFLKSKEGVVAKPNVYLSQISKFSLGIYGIHAFILLLVEKFFDIKSINPLWGILTFSVLVLGLSFIYSFLLRKVDKNGYVV